MLHMLYRITHRSTSTVLVVVTTWYPLTLAGGVQVTLAWLLPIGRAVTLPGGLEGAAVRE